VGLGRLSLIASLVSLASLACGATASAAAPPAGPRLAFFVSHPFPDAGSEVATVGRDGTAPLRLSGGSSFKAVEPMVDNRPSWSADGSLLAFVGSAGAASPAVFTVHADGTHRRPLFASRRIIFEGPPILAPDGSSVAIFRIDVISGHFDRLGAGSASADDQPLRIRTAIWSLDTSGKGLRPLTPWSRRRVLYPSSYSPDGTTLGATEWSFRPGAGMKAVAIDLRSGHTTVLAADAEEPVYAPDGRVAAVRDHIRTGKPPLEETTIKSSDLLVGAPGGRLTKVLSVRHGLAWPSWDPSAQRIAFTTLLGSERGLPRLDQSNSVDQVNADGSCPSILLSLKRGFFGGVAWQPGPGREADRIVC